MTTPRDRKTVLVVDDEVEIRESLEEALQDEGYDVVVAANGREAMLALPLLSRPCAVILDIIMPFMSGVEVYAAMRIDPQLADIPVVVSTSDPSRAPAGVVLMKKPIHLDQLLETVAGLF